MIPGKRYRPEDVLKVAWRRRLMILIPFVVVTSGTIAGARLLRDRWRSETLIVLIPQRIPESYVRATVTERIEDRLQTTKQQIMSRTRLERIIGDFNLYADRRRTEPLEEIVRQMRQDIDVQLVKGDALQVAYVSSDPHIAMKVTERLASLFIQENLRDREVLAEGTNQFLEAQLDDARRQLVDQEKKLAQYRISHSGELPTQQDANLTAVHNAEMRVEALVESINRDRDRRAMGQRQLVDAKLSESPPVPTARKTSGQDEAPGIAAQQLAATRGTLVDLESRLTPSHPDVVRMKRAVADLEKVADLERVANLEKKAKAEAAEASVSPASNTGLAPVDEGRRNRVKELQMELENLDQQIVAKERDERRLRDGIDAYQARIESAPKREAELAELTRDYDTLQLIYRGLLEKKQESKVAANLEGRQISEQFRVLDPARLPEKPFGPNRLRIELLGAAVALALGIGLAALMEYRDSSLRSEADVLTALKLPVAVLVPVLWTTFELQARRRRTVILASTGVLSFVAVGAALVWTLSR